MDIKERTNTPVPADALIVETVFGAQQVFEMLKKKKHKVIQTLALSHYREEQTRCTKITGS